MWYVWEEIFCLSHQVMGISPSFNCVFQYSFNCDIGTRAFVIETQNLLEEKLSRTALLHHVLLLYYD